MEKNKKENTNNLISRIKARANADNNYFSFLCYYCKRQITIYQTDQ